MTNPPTYTDGLGELVRALRLYLGLSRDGMAIQLKMSGRTYDRIETGERDCPPGFIDSIDDIVEKFEAEVAGWETYAKKHGDVEVPISLDPREEWRRSVVGRAAVITQKIVPVAQQNVTTPTPLG